MSHYDIYLFITIPFCLEVIKYLTFHHFNKAILEVVML